MNYRSIVLRTFLTIVALPFLVLGLSTCKNTDNVTKEASSGDISRLEAIYWERVDSSRMEFTQADVDFMTGMIGHHAQALIMSALAPENDASAEVQTLAARIANAQNDEIVTMQRWLSDRGQPVPEVHIDGLNLMIHGVGDHHSRHMNMPGMLTQEQLEELSGVRGSEFDRLFLTHMIEHHTGAVTMVKDLFNTDGAAQEEQAFRLASDIQVDQITEINRMKLMLGNLFDTN